MDYRGYCLWAPDSPSVDAPHFVVVSSSKNPQQQYLVVAISSIKYNDMGKAKYYDDACVLLEDDIKDEKGNNILSKPSFIRYQYALAMDVDELLKKQVIGGYKLKCKINDDVLRRIQEGAKISRELSPRLRAFFDYF